MSNHPTQQEILDAVRTVIRVHQPTAVSASISTHDQPYTGFYLNSVVLADGTVLEDSTDGFDGPYDDTWRLLSQLERGGLAAEDGMGQADLDLIGQDA